MMQEDLDEIFKITLYNFAHRFIWSCVTSSFGPGPCNFRPELILGLLESVSREESLSRVCFGRHLLG